MNPAEARDLLRKVKILAALDDSDLDGLAARMSLQRVHAGEEVVSHLDLDGQVFFAVEGVFAARLQSPAGRKVAIRLLQPGSHFGEIAAITNTPRSVAIFAETDGMLAKCPAETFVALMKSNGEFSCAVASHLARTVISLTDRVFELAALEVRFRVYAELLRLAAEAEVTPKGLLIRNTPTHEAIGAAIGSQREAVTRELRFLASEGVIQQTKRELLILDVERLREFLHRRAGATTSEAIDWRL